MPAQLSLLPKPDPIADQIATAEARGQRITPWVRHIVKVWAARNPKLPNTGSNKGKNPAGVTCMEAGSLPIICDCFYCSEPSVIFPPEDGSPPEGYCICQCCSSPACPHKPKTAARAA